MAESPIDPALRVQARSIYGSPVSTYAAGRPDYPAVVYETLAARCGLRPGAVVVENGPGTGLVTGHLRAAGARVVAVEPDEEMAAYLTERFPDVEVIVDTFEGADLEPGRFDLVVAATSFHWVDQAVGIPKVARCLKPGGWVALWWSIFDDPDRPDAFRDELAKRSGEDDPGGQRRVEFQMDTDARVRDLVAMGGFDNVSADLHRWNAVLDSGQMRALYASLINVARRPPEERSGLLAQVEAVAASLGPTVSRPFRTVFYSGRKPGPDA